MKFYGYYHTKGIFVQIPNMGYHSVYQIVRIITLKQKPKNAPWSENPYVPHCIEMITFS